MITGNTGKIVFDIPRNKIVGRGVRHFINATLAIFAFFALIDVFCWLQVGDDHFLEFSIFVLVVAVLVSMKFAYQYLITLPKKTPRQICVSDNAITVDDNVFPMSEIQRVKAFPPDDDDKTHQRITIFMANGKKYEYIVGSTNPDKPDHYDDYPLLCQTLSDLFGNDPLRFSFDL